MNLKRLLSGSTFRSALLALAIAAGIGAAPLAAQETIKVGQFASLTGSEATFGQSSDKGVRMAVDEINKAGGVLGKKLELITYDTQGKGAEASNAVTRLITSDHVVALLGEVASSLSLAGGEVAQANGVPMITHASTNPKVTEGRDMVFRICFIDPFQGYAVAKFASDDLKAKKVAILYDQGQAYSAGLRKDFVKAFKKMSGTITTEQSYTGGDQDFSAQLTTIRDGAPDAIFIPGYYNDVGNIALQARKLGITVPMLGGDGWDSSKLKEIAGKAIEGCYYSNHYTPEDPRPELQDFIKKFKGLYNKETPDAMAVLAYDSAIILADAIKRAGTTESKALAKAISETKDFKGITGTITLDANRNARKPAVILQMKEGEWRYAASVAPPTDDK
jgi:branched-chain amino acid transport system substrate-binding protein